jgi:hypothetical protein
MNAGTAVQSLLVVATAVAASINAHFRLAASSRFS